MSAPARAEVHALVSTMDYPMLAELFGGLTGDELRVPSRETNRAGPQPLTADTEGSPRGATEYWDDERDARGRGVTRSVAAAEADEATDWDDRRRKLELILETVDRVLGPEPQIAGTGGARYGLDVAVPARRRRGRPSASSHLSGPTPSAQVTGARSSSPYTRMPWTM